MLVTLAEWNVSDMVGDVGWELCVIIADWDRISNEVQRNDDWSEILLTVDGLRNFIIWEFEPAADQKKSIFLLREKRYTFANQPLVKLVSMFNQR